MRTLLITIIFLYLASVLYSQKNINEPNIVRKYYFDSEINITSNVKIYPYENHIHFIYTGAIGKYPGPYTSLDEITTISDVMQGTWLRTGKHSMLKSKIFDLKFDSNGNFKLFGVNSVLNSYPQVLYFDKTGKYLESYIDTNQINISNNSVSFYVSDNYMYYYSHNVSEINRTTIAKYNDSAILEDLLYLDTTGINSRVDLWQTINAFSMDLLGNYFILFKNSFPNTNTYSILTKFTSEGKHVWSKELKHPEYDTTFIYNTFEIANDGSIYILAYHLNGNDIKYSIIKLNNDGEIIWTHEEKINLFEHPTGWYVWDLVTKNLQLINNDRYIVLSGANQLGERSFWVRFYDSKEGKVIEEYNWYIGDIISSSEGISGVAVAPNGNLYLAGGGTNKVVLFEIKPTTVSIQDSYLTNTKNKLSISPLPSSDFITISGIDQGVNIEIYSLLGIKQFETLYTGKIDISRLSMGVYYVKVGEQVEKFVVGERRSALGGR